jgi:peroxiredoxin
MNQLDKELKGHGLEVIGINLDEEIEEANQFLQQTPASFSIAKNADQKCAKDFGVKAMPSSYLIDRQELSGMSIVASGPTRLKSLSFW